MIAGHIRMLKKITGQRSVGAYREASDVHHRTEEQALRGTDWPCYATQIVMVLDWLYQPPKTKLVARQIVFWLIFPLLL